MQPARFTCFPRRARLAAALSLSLACVPLAAHAQSAIVGALGNFDAANFEGRDAHGFEVQIEGITPADLYPAWCGNKYGCPTVTAYATGVYVRYQSPYDATNQVFTATTVPHASGQPFGGTCYMGLPSYYTSGCDHFGVHMTFAAAAKAVTAGYRWMFEDPANPGTLVASPTNIFVPTPVYTFVPPAVPTNPPTLVVEVQTPPPPPPPPLTPPQYGDATWMKVYKTELTREATLDDLTSVNPIETGAIVETEWALMQPSPPPDGNHRQRNKSSNSGAVNGTTRAVLRRYETYAYTGAYDPVTHEVVCGGDGTCSIPQPGELGDMLQQQMAAANVAIPSVTIAKSGNGNVASSDGVLSCGSKCSAVYPLDATVSLTAQAASGAAFTGWTGDCTGSAATCAVTVADAMAVTANFLPVYTLSVGRSNPGTITATPSGVDRALDCGSSCSAKFVSGTAVTLTAVPPAGKTFVGWSGACTGTAVQCTVTVGSNLSTTAAFSK